jgi:hypothetical protein
MQTPEEEHPKQFEKWGVEISTETKVADDIVIGLPLRLLTPLFGPGDFVVTAIDRDKGTATAMSGRLVALLAKRDDGWYDQHIHGNLDAVQRVQFNIKTRQDEKIDRPTITH